MSVQINSTIAKHNVVELPDMLDLALGIGADALHLFMLVPVGCGLEIAPAEMLPAEEYERVLHWFDDQSKTCPIDLKATCAPHYYRIRAERLEDDRARGDLSGTFIAPGTKAKAAPTLLHGGGHGQHLSAMTRGCLAGTAVCFVSNEGAVYPCGYLPVSAGSTRTDTFANIWRDSDVFRQLRDPDALEGKCGECRFQALCGGCRARAYAATGSFLAEEPFCLYRPDLDEKRRSKPDVGDRGDPGDGAQLKICRSRQARKPAGRPGSPTTRRLAKIRDARPAVSPEPRSPARLSHSPSID